MWLSKQLSASPTGRRAARRGRITGRSGETLTIQSREEHRNAPLLGPYGITALPALGSPAALLELEDGTNACVGTVQPACPALEPGEIRLCSAGGACILLKNDGTIQLNSTVIPAGEGKT